MNNFFKRILSVVILLACVISPHAASAKGLSFAEELHGYAYYMGEHRHVSVYLNVVIKDVDAWQADQNFPGQATGRLVMEGMSDQPVSGFLQVMATAPSDDGRLLVYSFKTSTLQFYGVKHVKNNGLSHRHLSEALNDQSKDGFAARLRMYLSLYERIAAEWERRLHEGKFIDFEDMLIQAAAHVESGAFKSPYTIILADEFQDSSRARIRLLKALAANPPVQTHLCVVGDDWQGINRFAGSDISVMTEFEKTFSHSTRLTLNTTFRCPQELCDVSSEFIQANPAQIKKTVRTTNPLSKTPMLAYGFQQKEGMHGHVEEQLADMYRFASEGKLMPAKGTHITIMMLGRYRDDQPAAIEAWQRRFGDRLKIDFRTAHSSKGLEAEYVFVLNVVQGTRGFPSQIQDDPALQLAMPAPDPYPYAEERRLFYVAMTRARKQVRFYTALSQPSQFLVELVKAKHIRIDPVDGEPLEACPRCGNGALQLRGGQYGAFHGCSRFPACDYKRRISQKEGKPHQRMGRSQKIRLPIKSGDQCPVCRLGTIQERNGRNGPFLGCSRYREGCRATANIH